MTQLTWFSINPPRDIDHPSVTAAIRSLASRPRMGTPPATPLVVFETWSVGGRLEWLLGVDPFLADELPAQLQAHAPRLAVTHLPIPHRPVVTVGMTVHSVGLSRSRDVLRVTVG
jgi:hypothetical protein